MFRLVFIIGIFLGVKGNSGPNIRLKRIRRVSGGIPVRIESVPYHVNIEYQRKLHVCGGNIISPKSILTAANCVPYDYSDYTVITGSSSIYYTGGMVYNVEDRYVYPNYGRLPNGQGDIAILRVKGQIRYSPTTRGIKLYASDSPVKIGDAGTLVGWGGRVRLETQLQQITIKVIDNSYCNSRPFSPGYVMPPKTFCTADLSGIQTACVGDAGGGLKIDDKLAGILSHGDSGRHCLNYQVFTKISDYREWILANTGI